MERYFLPLVVGICLLTTVASAQDVYDSTLPVDYSGLSNVATASTEYTNTGTMNGQRQHLGFRGFFFGGSSGYELAMVNLSSDRGMVRIGTSMYRLVNLQMARQDLTSTTSTTVTSPTARQVVAQFAAQLVAATPPAATDSSTVYGSTVDTASATVVGVIQGAIVRHGPPPPPPPTADGTTMPRPHHGMGPPPGGGPVLEASIQTSDRSGTILALSGGGHPGGHGHGRMQGMPTQ